MSLLGRRRCCCSCELRCAAWAAVNTITAIEFECYLNYEDATACRHEYFTGTMAPVIVTSASVTFRYGDPASEVATLVANIDSSCNFTRFEWAASKYRVLSGFPTFAGIASGAELSLPDCGDDVIAIIGAIDKSVYAYGPGNYCTAFADYFRVLGVTTA